MIETRFLVQADSRIGTVSPRLYGHFAEHLGRCCYDGLRLGAAALPAEVTHSQAMPGSETSIVTATASSTGSSVTVSFVNRHHDQPVSVQVNVAGTQQATRAQLLTADSPRVVNSMQAPDRVALSPLNVSADGAGQWRVELPPHSLATVPFS